MSELEKGYKYLGKQTCAADGMCQVRPLFLKIFSALNTRRLSDPKLSSP